MSELPYYPFRPIQLSRIQFQLAVELAAADAGQTELRRQILEQVQKLYGYLPRGELEIDGATVDFKFTNDPPVVFNGIRAEWID